MRRAATALAGLCAAVALCAGPAASAQAAMPWWQVLSGSRPSNLRPAPDGTEVQKLSTQKVTPPFSAGAVFVAPVEVGGEVVGCLGSGEFGETADELCESHSGGFPAIETAAELQALLEGPYGAGEVEVSGGPLGGEDFTITTPGRWVLPVQARPITASGILGPVELGKVAWRTASEGSGTLAITLTNLGDAKLDSATAPVTIADRLPAGARAYGVFDPVAGAQGSAGSLDCSVEAADLVSCSFEGALPPYEALEIDVLVVLEGAPGAPGEITVSGGGAATAHGPQPLSASQAPVPYGAERFTAVAEEEGGGPTRGAGLHPFQVTNTIQWNAGRLHGLKTPIPPSREVEADIAQPALPRNSRVTFPAGLVGSAIATDTCPLAVFLRRDERFLNECPASSAIGVASVTVLESAHFGLLRLAVPIFNLPPAHGEPARFGFMPAGTPVLIDTAVDPEDEYRITGEVRNAPQIAKVLSATLSLWGVPGDSRHDNARGWRCAYFLFEESECQPPSERRQTPFLRMPTSCRDPLGFDAALEPWNVPLGSLIARASATSAPLVACNRVPFDPHVSNALTSKLAANPSGLDLGIQMPGAGLDNPADGAVSEGQFKRAEIAFPRGVTVNPSIAEGLAVCSRADYGRERYGSAPGEGCPQASKIGSVEISTPLLSEKATGAVYQATPYENETDSLIGLYLVARIPERGILVKQPIEVRPDPNTGQLVSIAENVPQLPFSSFEFHFREGGRSPLITPPGCGTFATVAKFTPWSATDPDHPDPSEVVERRATFTVERGVHGGSCPSGDPPFAPGFEAGTLNNQAGSYSPFLLHLSRGDGEQDIGRFSFVLPPGVVPRLAGIPYCSEAGIARAASRQGPHGGEEEKSDPSCPAASEIGRTVAGAGAGSQLTYVPGRLYLAGPYHGDPISAVAITPAVAGPFDAGVVVVREALRLNPVTHVGEVDGAASDPIPHILKGIPLNLRDLHVYADRPEFTLNATSCEPFQARATLWGEGTALAPLAPHPAELSSRYQAAGCRALAFKPRLALRLKGGTRRGAFPALRALYRPRPGHANLRRLALTFPSSEFIEQGHFRTICTRVQFKAGPGFGARCPKGSIYGHVKAWSPLLDEPLKGPVYLRSSNHNLPDAVLALHGLIDIEVATRIDSVHGRLRAIVQNVPDAPVSRAVVRMQGGQKGLFVNSRNLCLKPQRNRARVNATAQNAKRDLTRPQMRALGCRKAKQRRHSRHRR